jgi:hypothetical protein
MTKKVYLIPTVRIAEAEPEQLLTVSLTSTGLDDDTLSNEGSGNMYEEALGRRRNSWGDDDY